MKAIITVDVPKHQIGQEVSVYFKDTMCVNGTCESETKVYAKHDEEVIKETVESIWGKPPYTEVLDEIRAEIEPKCDRINSLASVLSYAAHREIQELLCEIMDLFEPKSEDKE